MAMAMAHRGAPRNPDVSNLRQASMGSSNERIYSAKQLTEALRSAMGAVKEQLSVLAILDGTAIQWPGVAQALDDMQFMVDMTVQVREGRGRA